MTDLDLSAAKTAVSAALDAVDGVDCKPHYRQIARKGEALVRFAGLARDASGLGYLITLQALIALPQGIKDSEAWVEAHLDPIATALEAEVVITDAAPVQLQLDSGLVPALQITGIRTA